MKVKIDFDNGNNVVVNAENKDEEVFLVEFQKDVENTISKYYFESALPTIINKLENELNGLYQQYLDEGKIIN